MYGFEKIVKFEEFCHKCEHKNCKQDEEPCNSCLETPARTETCWPLNYKEDKNESSKVR